MINAYTSRSISNNQSARHPNTVNFNPVTDRSSSSIFYNTLTATGKSTKNESKSKCKNIHEVKNTYASQFQNKKELIEQNQKTNNSVLLTNQSRISNVNQSRITAISPNHLKDHPQRVINYSNITKCQNNQNTPLYVKSNEEYLKSMDAKKEIEKLDKTSEKKNLKSIIKKAKFVNKEMENNKTEIPKIKRERNNNYESEMDFQINEKDRKNKEDYQRSMYSSRKLRDGDQSYDKSAEKIGSLGKRSGTTESGFNSGDGENRGEYRSPSGRSSIMKNQFIINYEEGERAKTSTMFLKGIEESPIRQAFHQEGGIHEEDSELGESENDHIRLVEIDRQSRKQLHDKSSNKSNNNALRDSKTSAVNNNINTKDNQLRSSNKSQRSQVSDNSRALQVDDLRMSDRKLHISQTSSPYKEQITTIGKRVMKNSNNQAYNNNSDLINIIGNAMSEPNQDSLSPISKDGLSVSSPTRKKLNNVVLINTNNLANSQSNYTPTNKKTQNVIPVSPDREKINQNIVNQNQRPGYNNNNNNAPRNVNNKPVSKNQEMIISPTREKLNKSPIKNNQPQMQSSINQRLQTPNSSSQINNYDESFNKPQNINSMYNNQHLLAPGRSPSREKLNKKSSKNTIYESEKLSKIISKAEEDFSDDGNYHAPTRYLTTRTYKGKRKSSKTKINELKHSLASLKDVNSKANVILDSALDQIEGRIEALKKISRKTPRNGEPVFSDYDSSAGNNKTLRHAKQLTLDIKEDIGFISTLLDKDRITKKDSKLKSTMQKLNNVITEKVIESKIKNLERSELSGGHSNNRAVSASPLDRGFGLGQLQGLRESIRSNNGKMAMRDSDGFGENRSVYGENRSVYGENRSIYGENRSAYGRMAMRDSDENRSAYGKMAMRDFDGFGENRSNIDRNILKKESKQESDRNIMKKESKNESDGFSEKKSNRKIKPDSEIYQDRNDFNDRGDQVNINMDLKASIHPRPKSRSPSYDEKMHDNDDKDKSGINREERERPESVEKVNSDNDEDQDEDQDYQEQIEKLDRNEREARYNKPNRGENQDNADKVDNQIKEKDNESNNTSSKVSFNDVIKAKIIKKEESIQASLKNINSSSSKQLHVNIDSSSSKHLPVNIDSGSEEYNTPQLERTNTKNLLNENESMSNPALMNSGMNHNNMSFFDEGYPAIQRQFSTIIKDLISKANFDVQFQYPRPEEKRPTRMDNNNNKNKGPSKASASREDNTNTYTYTNRTKLNLIQNNPNQQTSNLNPNSNRDRDDANSNYQIDNEISSKSFSIASPRSEVFFDNFATIKELVEENCSLDKIFLLKSRVIKTIEKLGLLDGKTEKENIVIETIMRILNEKENELLLKKEKHLRNLKKPSLHEYSFFDRQEMRIKNEKEIQQLRAQFEKNNKDIDGFLGKSEYSEFFRKYINTRSLNVKRTFFNFKEDYDAKATFRKENFMKDLDPVRQQSCVQPVSYRYEEKPVSFLHKDYFRVEQSLKQSRQLQNIGAFHDLRGGFHTRKKSEPIPTPLINSITPRGKRLTSNEVSIFPSNNFQPNHHKGKGKNLFSGLLI